MIALIGNHNLVSMAQTVIKNPVAYAAMSGYNAVTDTFDEVDYFSYKAVTSPALKSKKGSDPDFPTYGQAMAGPDADDWLDAMRSEVDTLTKLKAWTIVPREMAEQMGKKVIKSTWAFRQK